MNQIREECFSHSALKKETSGYQTLQDIVYQKLRNDILSGNLQPDAVLNTSELSRQTNISRTPIREAINKLASVGLVQKVNNHEAKVASFMSDEIHEIFYMRAALEGIAARMAARNMTIENKRHLLHLAEECVRCAKEDADEKFFEVNHEFHHLIYTSVKTQLIRETINHFYIITQRYRRIGYQLGERKRQVAEEHILMALAILEGNESKAEHFGNLHHTNTIMIIDENWVK